MPRYFFDLKMGEGELEVDLEGVTLVGPQAAKQEALRAMGELLRERLAQGKPDSFIMQVRDEAGTAILRTAVTVRHEKI